MTPLYTHRRAPGVLLSLMADGVLKGKLAALGAARPLTTPPSTSTAPLGREGEAFSAKTEKLS